MQIQEQLIFPNFSYTTSFDNINTAEIEKFIQIKERTEQGRQCSNVGGWQEDIMLDSNPAKDKLLAQCLDVCQEVCNSWKLDSRVIIKNAWANVNRRNNLNFPHYHPKSVFSGIYYVKADPQCGNLVLKRPDMQEHYIDQLNSEHTQKDFSIVPEPGMFVMFPAYIAHYVEQNLSDEDRISIAINFDIQ